MKLATRAKIIGKTLHDVFTEWLLCAALIVFFGWSIYSFVSGSYPGYVMEVIVSGFALVALAAVVGIFIFTAFARLFEHIGYVYWVNKKAAGDREYQTKVSLDSE